MTSPKKNILLFNDPVAAVRAIENAWNLRDLDAIVLGNSIDCLWRHKTDFLWGREQVRTYLSRKWRCEHDLRIVFELWAVEHRRVAVRFATEFRDDSGVWFRVHGNESWECDVNGIVHRRLTSENDHPILEHERILRWLTGIRPADHPGLSELGV
ncbi:MAG: hypothetical protein VR75_15815 [Hyphomonadaceae bacterium BRH_c29]|nr:MAG: hypothetical protein VR75_15815 [Hyphomonadaceae bacterium BRH_c29]